MPRTMLIWTIWSIFNNVPAAPEQPPNTPSAEQDLQTLSVQGKMRAIHGSSKGVLEGKGSK